MARSSHQGLAPGFTLRRFGEALMDLGCPALGLLGTAVERG